MGLLQAFGISTNADLLDFRAKTTIRSGKVWSIKLGDWATCDAMAFDSG